MYNWLTDEELSNEIEMALEDGDQGYAEELYMEQQRRMMAQEV